jgi:Cu(I)/Ag(I) efflux system membrane fusion protein
MSDASHRPGWWRQLAWSMKVAQVRLRFVAALAIAFLVIGRWDVLRTHWDRWTSAATRDPAMGAVSSDTEYFCPMDPGVLTDWPSKCPICYMALVRRSKGDMGPAPSGVISRAQISPGRVQLGGIQAEVARYRPLAREIRSVGEVDGLTVRAALGTEEATWLTVGQAAELVPDPPDGSGPTAGKVTKVARDGVEIGLARPLPGSGKYAGVMIRVPMAGREPFRSMPRGEPPAWGTSPKFVYICTSHPEVFVLKAGRCPKADETLERLDLAENQRVGWRCPMHPGVMADEAGKTCEECGGMVLVPRVVSYCPAGEVLSIPENAVIDTGALTMVYVERLRGVFEGVKVRLGPRCEGYYPVVEGLEAGTPVAAAGAFLVDAETRLNPSLAASYFGAKREISAAPALKMVPAPDLTGLSEPDRGLALAQGTCPVTGKALGSMGTPIKVDVRGKVLYLCCDGCEGRVKAEPAKYLAKLRSAPAVHHP